MLRFLRLGGLRACALLMVAALGLGGLVPGVAAEEGGGATEVYLTLQPEDDALVGTGAEVTWHIADQGGEEVTGETETLPLGQTLLFGYLNLGSTYYLSLDAGDQFEPVVGFPLEIPTSGMASFVVPLVQTDGDSGSGDDGGGPSLGDTPGQEMETSIVTISLSSANPDIASQMSEDASWSVSQDGEVLISDTFLAAHRDLTTPQSIEVESPVPYGTYDITVNGGSNFVLFGAPVEISEPEQVVAVVLQPVIEEPGEAETSWVTVNLSSADPEIASALPADASWTVWTVDGTVIATDTFAAEHLELPATIPVSNALPYETYVVGVDASPAFAYYEAPHIVGQPEQEIDIVLRPYVEQPEAAEVVLNLSSTDPDAASVMPEGATWTIASLDNPNFTLVGEFTGDELELPTSILLDQALAFGDYVVTIDAQPTFELASAEFTVDAETADPLAMGKMTFFQTAAPVNVEIALVPALQAAPEDPADTEDPAPTDPADEDPVDDAAPEEPAEDDAAPEAEDAGDDDPAPAEATTVTALPKTGHGSVAAGAGAATLLLALAGAMAATAAFTLRAKRV